MSGWKLFLFFFSLQTLPCPIWLAACVITWMMQVFHKTFKRGFVQCKTCVGDGQNKENIPQKNVSAFKVVGLCACPANDSPVIASPPPPKKKPIPLRRAPRLLYLLMMLEMLDTQGHSGIQLGWRTFFSVFLD